jgi:thiamine pyrophosphate-dependent acetolactate synthase large subunit-like protein
MKACGGYGEKVSEPSALVDALKRCLAANAQGQSALLNLITGD